MSAISRRTFVKTAATCAAAGFLSTRLPQLRANPLGMPIGCQTWPVRTMIAKDFPGTIKTLADAGFQRIELCSPVGYADSGFGGLAEYKGAELRKILGDAGVSCESSHFGIKELRDNLPDRIAWAKDVGLTQMMVPSLDGPKNPTMDDVKRAADEYNKMAEQTAKAGIQQGLHNETFELSQVDGRRTYDMLFDLLDPKLVKFQFQCLDDQPGLRCRRVLHEVSRPLHFHARAGLVAGNEEDDGRRPGNARLEEDLHRGQDWRHQELLRRDEPGLDEGERSLPSQAGGLMSVGIRNAQSNWQGGGPIQFLDPRCIPDIADNTHSPCSRDL